MRDFDPFKVASEWHSGQGSALYSFSSTGAVHDQEHKDRLETEIEQALVQAKKSKSFSSEDLEELEMLLYHVKDEPLSEGNGSNLRNALGEISVTSESDSESYVEWDDIDELWYVMKGDKAIGSWSDKESAYEQLNREKNVNESQTEACNECGMSEGHSDSCSHNSDDKDDYSDDNEDALSKRLHWNEVSDYDGLPLNESSMFNRFNTLVGHRPDGTFDNRNSESSKLRAIVKKNVIEMKLSIAGPAFGGAQIEDPDDEEQDRKVTAAKKKVPAPKSSGTRLKSKTKTKKSKK